MKALKYFSIVAFVFAGIMLRPILEEGFFGEKDPLDEDAVFLVKYMEDGGTYKLSDGKEVDISLMVCVYKLEFSFLKVDLEDGTSLISEKWIKGFRSPSNDAKNLACIKRDPYSFKKSDYSPEEFRPWSEKYQSIIKEVSKILRNEINSKKKFNL